jgi:PAS domain S-box-containing protein
MRARARDVLNRVGLTYAVMVVGSVAAAVFLLAPPGSGWQLVVWPVPFVLGTLMLGLRVVSNPSSIRGPLTLLLFGALLYFAASVVWYVGPVWLGYELGFPSPLDAVYFAVYTAYAVFLLSALRRRATEAGLEGRLALVDAGVLTAALSAVLWVFVIDPNLEEGLPLLATVVAVLYPGFQLLLFALGVRLAMSVGLRNGGVVVPLLLWLGGELFADIFYGFRSANGTFAYQAWLIAVWLMSFTGLAALAAHPRFVDLLRPDGASAAARGEGVARHHHAPDSGMGTAGRRRRWGWHGVLLGAALVPLLLAHLTPGNDPMVVAGVIFALVLYRVSLVAGDLAEQRRLGDELASAVRQLRAQRDELSALAAAVDATADAVVTASTDGMIVGWNRGAERMYGYAAAEALGCDIAMLIPSEHRQLMGEWVAALAEHGHTSFEREVLRKDGTRLVEEVTLSNVCYESGRVSAVVHIGRDVTQRRAMQREVAAHVRRLDEAQRIAGVGSWEWRPASQEVTWSAELRRIFGFGPGTAVSVAVFLDHVHPDDRPAVEQRISEAVQKTGVMDFETRAVRADGQIRWIAVRGETHRGR